MIENPSKKFIRVIGIDPGTNITGYGILDFYKTEKKTLPIAAGAFVLNKKKQPLQNRLAMLACEFRKILNQYQPTQMCIELSFVYLNPHTALLLGHARGVLMSEAAQLGLEVFEISSTSAKKHVTGFGHASKKLISETMTSLLKINKQQLPLDATDALAIAYSHIISKI